MPRNLWDEITHPFPNLNGRTDDVWEWISNFILHIISMLGLKLNSVSEGATGNSDKQA